MQYFRSICSSLILFLISIILVANQGPTASGFETQGAKGPTSFDLGLPVHQDITREGLPFLKSDTLESIVSQHVKIEQNASSPNHFDNCQFTETVVRINQRYDAAVAELNPKFSDLPRAEENFGYILHAAQDFYSHTNWVEMGRTDLIDPWLGHWRPLNGYTLSSNDNPVFILEEDGKPHSDFQIHKNAKVIVVNNEMWYADGSGSKMGLISGTYDADVSKCPTSASIPHGGRTSTVTNRLYSDESRDLPDELNKDNPARQGFGAAKLLARQQTTHEFCRLVDLVREAYGDAGVKFINDNWIQTRYLTNSPANNSICLPTDSTQVRLPQDSPTSVEDKVVSIPSWVKHNAQYWSDGSLTDKDFATGIGYLVQHKIISANVTTNKDGTILVNDNLSIPKWIKNNAKYWSEGSISDSDFKSGIEFMVNQKIISFSEPVQKQGTISNDDLKLLYATSKQYERTTSSILTLNDNQEKVLQGLTASDWYKNTQDPKIAIHAQVLDLLIKKQDFDKQNIQKVLDTTSSISNKIKDYAIKQGVSSSDLDKISTVPLKNQNTANDPISVLKQSADDVQKNVAGTPPTQYRIYHLDEDKYQAHQLAEILGSNNFPLSDIHSDSSFIATLNKLILDTDKILLDNDGDITTTGDQEILKSTLKSVIPLEQYSQQSADEKSKQNVLDLMQQAIDLLQKEEQGETDSILNYISTSGMLDLSPIEKSPIQLQSKHGSYEPVGDSDTYVIYGSWVLKSQNGIEHKVARYHIFSSTNTGYNIQGDAKIEEGVIKASSGFDNPIPPGTWFLELSQIDGNLPPPTDSRIEVVILSKSSVPPTPNTVQTTPIVPTTPLTQTSLEFTVPSQIVQEATSSSGAIVSFTTAFSSPGDSSNQIITCTPTSGSQFPLGNTVVTCTATDLQSQKILKKSFTVIIRDTTPPAISPFNPHNDTPDDSGAIVYFTMEAIDLVDGHVTLHCDHTSGSKFPIGNTIVTCTADDSKGNHSERKLGINIQKS